MFRLNNIMAEQRISWQLMGWGFSLLLIMASAQALQKYWQQQTPPEQQWQLICSTQGNYWVKLDANGTVVARRDTAPAQ